MSFWTDHVDITVITHTVLLDIQRCSGAAALNQHAARLDKSEALIVSTVNHLHVADSSTSSVFDDDDYGC